MRNSSRRAFLKLAASTALSTSLIGCAGKHLLGRKPKSVIVVGGGLAGLTAAYELEALGYSVTILEASRRVGGRVFTQRTGFLDGQMTELGATRVADVHALTLAYVKKFGLELDLFSDSKDTRFYFQNQPYVRKTEAPAPLPERWGMSERERKAGIDSVLASHLETGLAFKPRENLDAFSYSEFLKSQNASPGAFALVKADGGSDCDRYNARAWVEQSERDRAWNRSFHIRGGNDSLPTAIATRIRGKIELQAKVLEIHSAGLGKASVTYAKENQTQRIEADAIVVTVSPAVANQIRFMPGLSEAKQKAFRDLKMAPVTKMSLAFRDRFWAKEGVQGLTLAYTDQVIERLWDLSSVQPGKSGLLVAYLQSENSIAMSKLKLADQVARTEKAIRKIFPKTFQNSAHAYSFSWQNQPWVQGAWVSYAKNQYAMIADTAASEGRLFFGGDHTSIHCGWMQGAIESGLRVTNEIWRSLG